MIRAQIEFFERLGRVGTEQRVIQLRLAVLAAELDPETALWIVRGKHVGPAVDRDSHIGLETRPLPTGMYSIDAGTIPSLVGLE